MAQEAIDEAGNIWIVDGFDANGNPINPRPKPRAQSKGTIYTPPPQPEKPTEPPAGYRWGPNGSYEFIPGGPADPSRPGGPLNPATPQKSATEIELAAKKEAEAKRAATVDNLMKEVRGYYANDIQGQPASRLFGATEYIPWLPKNERFNAASNAILPMIRPLVAQTAKEGDSDKEMQVFMAYIPQAGDSDITIEQKLRGLDILVSGMTSGKPPSEIVQGMQNAPPPPAAGGVGDTSGMQRVATGDRRWVDDTETDQTLYNMFRQGRSFEEMQAYAGTRGYRLDPNPEAFAYARKNPGYNPFKRAGRYEELSTRQKLARTPLAGYAGGATNALTFGLNDELYGAANALVGEDYTQARDRFQGAKRAVADMNPVSDILGNITGGMLLPAGAAAVGSRAAPGLTSAAVGALARNPVKSAGAYGAAYGAGDQNDNRLLGAAVGGVGGMGGGAAGKYLLGPLAAKIGGSSGGQAVANALEPVAGRIRQAIGGGARVAPAQISRAESMIGQSIGDMAPVRQNIADAAEMGLPFSLADADPRLRMLAGTVTRKSPDARALAENALEPRAMGQIDRLLGGIDDNLAQRVNIEQRGKQLIEAGRTEAAPYYNMANSAPAQVDDQINAYLQTPAGRDALRRAYDIAANEGRDPVALGFAVDDAGEVVMREAPTFETLDLVKRGLDSKLNEARNPITGALDLEGNPQLGAIETLRKGFVGRMDQLNPQYPQARGAFAKWAQKRDALNAGQALAAPGRLPRDVENALPRLSQNLDEVQRGYATGMGDTAEKLRYSANPYDAVMGSPSTQQKMRMLFPEGADKMLRRYELEREMGKTRYETLGGSPTAARQAMDETFSPMLAEQAGNIVGGVTTGAPTAGTAIRMGLAGLKFGMGKRAEKKAAELAPILFDQNPAGLLTYFDDVATRLKANEAYKNKWKGRAGLFGGSLTAPLLLNATSGY